MTLPILELAGVSKAFPGVQALDGVRLELYPGEITALVGENGAGKSTLVKILTGIYQPDAGSLQLDGRPLAMVSPQAALAAGITAIHQETVMFDELSVAENVFIGHQPRRGLGLVDWATMHRRTREILVQLEVELDPAAPLKTLSVAQKHVVGIARALSVDARIVIMDEPTAALSRREIEDLFQIVRRLRAEGKAILFISHKFDEIFALCDRYVALRDGCFIGAGQLAETSQDELVTMMVGRTVDQVFPKRQVPIGEVVLEVDGLSPPDRVRGHRLQPAPGRDPGLLRPGRRRAQRGHAGAVRHHATVPRPGPPGRAGGPDHEAERRDPRRHRLRPRGPPAPGCRAADADRAQHRPAAARPPEPQGLPRRRGRVRARPPLRRKASGQDGELVAARARSSRAATSRRW